MKTKFITNKNEVSMYGFICGHIEKKQVKDLKITLEFDCIFHVKVSRDGETGLVSWMSFETLTEARKAYKQKIKAINNCELI